MTLTRNGAYGLLAFAVFLWAASGTITTLALNEGVSVVELTTFAYIFASIVFLPIVAIFDRRSLRIDRRDIPTFIAFSFVAGAMVSLAFFGAIDETTVAIAVILEFAYPSMIVVASFFIFKEGLSKQKLLALPLTFIGCVLVAGSPAFEGGVPASWLAIGLGLLSAVGTAAYFVWGKKLQEKYSANTVTLYLFVFAAIMLSIGSNPFSLFRSSFTANAWVLIFLLGVLPGIVGFLASFVALRYIEAGKAGIVSSMEPMLAIGIAFMILSEGVTTIQVIGATVIVGGVMLLSLGKS